MPKTMQEILQEEEKLRLALFTHGLSREAVLHLAEQIQQQEQQQEAARSRQFERTLEQLDDLSGDHQAEELRVFLTDIITQMRAIEGAAVMKIDDLLDRLEDPHT